ncbi:MAG: molybdopterin cofactor-binding domain-containing protein, partial [Pseudomonadota bacterium]
MDGVAKDGVRTSRRHDSAEKQVAGNAPYADDIPEPKNLLHVHIAGSDFAYGAIGPLDLTQVRAAPGVVWVGTADDIPGENNTGPVFHDEEMLAGSEHRPGRVHFHGQPLFLVAATTVQLARAAATLAQFEKTEETPLLTIDDAIDAGSLLGEPYKMERGDVDLALEKAPHRLQGEIEIGGQEQFYLEGQIAVVTPGEDGDMHVVSSNQHPSECQLLVAAMLGEPAHSVTVEVRRLGGGFGGKETQGNLMACAAALVAHHTGRPAKCRLDRDQDMILTGKRHEVRVAYDLGFDHAGRILGADITQHVRCGWSADLSHAISDRAMFHADNCYYLPAARITSYRLRTNTCSNTAFRGFGGPQGMVGAERMVDHISWSVFATRLEDPAHSPVA